jgi:hypothetical protein
MQIKTSQSRRKCQHQDGILVNINTSVMVSFRTTQVELDTNQEVLRAVTRSAWSCRASGSTNLAHVNTNRSKRLVNNKT